MKGCFTFVLHSHLPYVIGHGVWPHGMDWVFEASAESYIPILRTIKDLVDEGISPKITIGITPVLAEQLLSEEFKEGFKNYLSQKIKASIDDKAYFEKIGENSLARLSCIWGVFYERILKDFDEYNCDIIGKFREFQDRGHIEIITSAGTHAYLPLIGRDSAVSAQIKLGVSSYKKHFGREPDGIWLPECAYRPGYEWKSPISEKKFERKGIEYFLEENNIKYFIIDTPLLKGGKTIGVYADRFPALKELWMHFEKGYKVQDEINRSPYQSYFLESNVACFTRDPKTALQVWSGEHGYPGDRCYLDFHKKHFPGGLRYWSVTSAKSDLGSKKIYEPEKIEERIRENAGHFKWLVKTIIDEEYKKERKPCIVCSPYDTELFGHWWFEGTRFLYYVIKWASQDPEISLKTCGEYLEEYPGNTIIKLPEGSWGEGGFHWIWLNEWTEWTWKLIYDAEDKLEELVKIENQDTKLQDIIKQASREVLLLESSDWQFLISTWSARDYAENRVCDHYEAFNRLYNMAKKYNNKEILDETDWIFLGDRKKKNVLFPEINLDWWR